MTTQTTFTSQEEANKEQIRQGITPTQNKPKEKSYYTRPVTNYFNGNPVTTNIIYSADEFNPGPMKYRIYSVEGTSKVVEAQEYYRLMDDVKWFSSEADAKQASYKAKLTINDLGKVIEKKTKAKPVVAKATEPVAKATPDVAIATKDVAEPVEA